VSNKYIRTWLLVSSDKASKTNIVFVEMRL